MLAEIGGVVGVAALVADHVSDDGGFCGFFGAAGATAGAARFFGDWGVSLAGAAAFSLGGGCGGGVD